MEDDAVRHRVRVRIAQWGKRSIIVEKSAGICGLFHRICKIVTYKVRIMCDKMHLYFVVGMRG